MASPRDDFTWFPGYVGVNSDDDVAEFVCVFFGWSLVMLLSFCVFFPQCFQFDVLFVYVCISFLVFE